MLRVQVNRGLDGKFKKISDMLEGYKDRYLELMSAYIINVSPVDTGTYITAHNLGSSEVPQTESSSGKPRKQPWEPFSEEGFNKLLSQVPNVGNQAVFSNGAYHADEVEYTHGYFVYTSAAREHKRIAQEAAQDVKART